MIVRAEFPGDDNVALMDVQHSAYDELIVHLFVQPRDRYLAAARLIRAEDELSSKLKLMAGFDHRTIQSAHDRIAAQFRFISPHSGQLRLGEDEDSHRQRLAEEWRQFFISAVAALVADDEFTRAVCTATVFGNKDPGLTAERWLNQFLLDRYTALGQPEWLYPGWSSIRLPV
jgi:hypothetical protein